MLKRVTLYRNISILLISISLVAPMIYCIDFYYNRMLHRLEMWSEAEKGLLQTIQVDSATIPWTKKGRELIVNGAYFDVVSISFANGRAVIKGVFDNEETEMHEAFAKKQTNDNAPGNTTQKIAKWLQQHWTIEEPFSANYFTLINIKIYSAKPPSALFHNHISPPTPPPWNSSTILFS